MCLPSSEARQRVRLARASFVVQARFDPKKSSLSFSDGAHRTSARLAHHDGLAGEHNSTGIMCRCTTYRTGVDASADYNVGIDTAHATCLPAALCFIVSIVCVSAACLAATMRSGPCAHEHGALLGSIGRSPSYAHFYFGQHNPGAARLTTTTWTRCIRRVDVHIAFVGTSGIHACSLVHDTSFYACVCRTLGGGCEDVACFGNRPPLCAICTTS